MKYLSVCSGIEAATVAWHPLGWQPFAFAEIEKFPSAVLAHHYPSIPNLGDMTKFKDWPDADIDVLVGGTPCQSFSVAGLRKGMADPRGNLALTYLAIADRYRPEWLVWENVPGVLSSSDGRDFGAFIGGLAELGYHASWRVLDAQYVRVDGFARAVPQRRRRVFVVGHLGDWRRPAAVLFERESLLGNTPPRRQAGQGFAADIAPSIVSSGRGVERAGDTRGQDPVVAVSGALMAKDGRDVHSDMDTFVAHTLKGEGFDAGEDSTGRGTPLIPVPFDTTQITSKTNRSQPHPGDPCHPLAAGAHAPAIAFDCKASGQSGFGVGEVASTMRAMGHANSHTNGGGHQAVAFQSSQSGVRLDDVHATLDSNNGSRRHNGVMEGWAVRRLTPRECERLQGFQDDYTAIPKAADGPRYKALGNSMAVNVMRWIGRRIELTSQLSSQNGGTE